MKDLYTCEGRDRLQYGQLFGCVKVESSKNNKELSLTIAYSVSLGSARLECLFFDEIENNAAIQEISTRTSFHLLLWLD